MITAALLILAASVAQPLLPSQPPLAPGQGAAAPGDLGEVVEVVAIEAKQTGTPHIDPSLVPFQALFKELPFDSFDLVFRNEQQVNLGSSAVFPVGAGYTVYVTLASQTSQQQVGLEVAVTTGDVQQPVNALRASGLVPRGRAVVFRGLELPGGELVVLVRVKPPSDQEDQEQQQQSASAQQQEQQQNQDQQQEPNEESDSQDAQEQREDEQQEQMAQQEPSEQDQERDAEEQEQAGPSPEELQNIEAILESLREQDRREQKDAQNRRQRVIVPGDWW